MALTPLMLESAHPTWHETLQQAWGVLDPEFRGRLLENENWQPGHALMLKAFSLPISKVKTVLFGESPYPLRTDGSQSANGYAFWDAQVGGLWTEEGRLSKEVNRATSLRNIVKMLLLCKFQDDPLVDFDAEILKQNKAQSIENVPKEQLVKTLDHLFENLLAEGFLLLNSFLLLPPGLIASQKVKEARMWQPFVEVIIDALKSEHGVTGFNVIAFGKPAKQIESLPSMAGVELFISQHPYNVKFTFEKAVQSRFGGLSLLDRRSI